jgi:hypothetical protein
VYLLRYKRDGEWRLVVIADAYSVAHARMVAAGLGAGRFVDGRQINRASVALLPPDAVGRVLTLAELTALVEDEKKPPARSVRRPRAGDARLGRTELSAVGCGRVRQTRPGGPGHRTEPLQSTMTESIFRSRRRSLSSKSGSGIDFTFELKAPGGTAKIDIGRLQPSSTPIMGADHK